MPRRMMNVEHKACHALQLECLHDNSVRYSILLAGSMSPPSPRELILFPGLGKSLLAMIIKTLQHGLK